MKKLLAIIVLSLCFITSSQANDVSEFQIEGISVGDSLLDYMSEKDIIHKSSDKYFYKNDEYYYNFYPKLDFLKVYDSLQIIFKTNDPEYIVQGVQGVIRPININKCLNKIKEIKNEIDIILNHTGVYNKIEHPLFKGSTVERYTYDLGNDQYAEVVCYDMNKKSNRVDSLYVIIYGQNFFKFSRDVQFKK
ncbi:hypothetical protein OAB09_04530 [Pelagibacteraceae bacterium]|nr:hypothetical protein [Pelagibacteraceae bacterium]